MLNIGSSSIGVSSTFTIINSISLHLTSDYVMEIPFSFPSLIKSSKITSYPNESDFLPPPVNL